ncbi:hypothetical protein Barb7_03206 [Bacteroidales bacterium Barb7]|nr:hypothetical protein Barb7_03206 [Bacteroidales bacterium Barb7]
MNLSCSTGSFPAWLVNIPKGGAYFSVNFALFETLERGAAAIAGATLPKPTRAMPPAALLIKVLRSILSLFLYFSLDQRKDRFRVNCNNVIFHLGVVQRFIEKFADIVLAKFNVQITEGKG